MSESQTIFQLVGKVLDQLKVDVDNACGNKGDAAVTQCLNNLSEAYGKLTDPSRKPVDYAAPENRLAYVYCYVAAHSDYVYQILNRTTKILGSNLTARKKIVVTALGGGPGSDLVGLMQYLVECNDCKLETVTAYLCDREQAWADCWTEIGEEVQAGFRLNVNFQPLDVTNADSWTKQKKYLSADLFLLVYFASEVASLGEKAAQFWAELSMSAKAGSYMLVIDNDHTFFNDFIVKNVVGKNWSVLKEEGLYLTPSGDEQKSDLGEHLQRYGRHPKLKGDLRYWVLERKA